MAYFPMIIGGKKYTETSLWTNPSPTSDFAAQDVTLSQSMANFKYLKIRWKNNKTSTTEGQNGSSIISIDDFEHSVASNYYAFPMLGGNSGSATYDRTVVKTSNTTINISVCKQRGANTNANNMIIPLEILGLNELDTGKRFDETSLWTNSAPTSSFAAQTVNLSESIENFDYIGIKYCYNNVSYQTISRAIYTVDELKASLVSSGADHNIITLGLMTSGNVGYCRNVYYSSNTSVAFSTGYRMNASGTSNNACNPLEIIGLKFA